MRIWKLLIDAGVSSFKIEGRLKGAAYVKNVTAFYRRKLDEIIARRPELSRTSQGDSAFTFEPAPEKVFNRGQTDYFVHGRQYDQPYELAELESPKHAGEPAAVAEEVLPGASSSKASQVSPSPTATVSTYLADDEEIRGIAVNRAEPVLNKAGKPIPVCGCSIRSNGAAWTACVRALVLKRNRDHAFLRMMEGKTAERKIPIDLIFTTHEDGLDLIASDGVRCAAASVALDLQTPSDLVKTAPICARSFTFGRYALCCRQHIHSRRSGCVCAGKRCQSAAPRRCRRPASASGSGTRKPRRAPWDDASPYPERILGFKANTANDQAAAFYAAHGARVTMPAFEIKPAPKADLMTCRHCVRASLKLCPKMLKAFPEILQTTDRALLRPEPLVLVNSAGERFKAYFHCKASPCEMTITPEGDFVRARAPRTMIKTAPSAEAAGRSTDTHPDERRRCSEKGAPASKACLKSVLPATISRQDVPALSPSLTTNTARADTRADDDRSDFSVCPPKSSLTSGLFSCLEALRHAV